jgi:nucleoside-diphosphate-sugar epimerase
MRILITGAAGMIATKLGRRLADLKILASGEITDLDLQDVATLSAPLGSQVVIRPRLSIFSSLVGLSSGYLCGQM